MNERLTEIITRDLLKKNEYYDDESIIVEEQISKFDNVSKLLKKASKSGKNKPGFPEFIITSDQYPDYIIVVECKPSSNKHESPEWDKPKDYAVDGALHYSKKLSKEFNVISLAVSGSELSKLKISVFFQEKNTSEPIRIKTTQGDTVEDIVPFSDLVNLANFDPIVSQKRMQDVLEYSRKVHNFLRNHAKLSEAQKPLVICGSLIALNNESFRANYSSYSLKDLPDEWYGAIKRVISSADIPNLKKEAILNSFIQLRDHPKLTAKQKFSSGVLGELIKEIDINVFPFVNIYESFDLLGSFFNEFLKYSGGDKQSFGIVLTPHHITELFCELADLRTNDVVVDTCCGTGGFLVSAMNFQLKRAKSEQEREEIKTNNIVGAEDMPEMFTLAAGNMILRGDGKSNIYSGDCFSKQIKSKLQDHKPSVGLINPPFSQDDEDKSLSELSYVINMLEILSKNGRGLAIVPMSCSIMPSNEKREILKNHTLEAVISLPDDLFYPVGTVTCAMIFTAHVPHNELKKTWFGYGKNDGFIKDRILGRADVNDVWKGLKKVWVESYLNRTEVKDFSLMQSVNEEDEWCAEAYMETDYSSVTQSDYKKTVESFLVHVINND